MKALDRRLWAKEEVADAVISFLRDKLEHDQGLDADDRAELELQARRAARFLGMEHRLDRGTLQAGN